MIRIITAAALLSLAAAAPAKDKPNTLTHGMVQMTLRVGVTTQQEVIENFGGPNVTTIDGWARSMDL